MSISGSQTCAASRKQTLCWLGSGTSGLSDASETQAPVALAGRVQFGLRALPQVGPSEGVSGSPAVWFSERSSLLPFADCLFVRPAPLGWRNTPARDDVFGALPASVAADGETHAGDCTAAAARHVDELAMFRAWSRVDDGANAVSPNRPDGLFL